MKKKIVCLMAAVYALSIFAGCGSGKLAADAAYSKEGAYSNQSVSVDYVAEKEGTKGIYSMSDSVSFESYGKGINGVAPAPSQATGTINDATVYQKAETETERKIIKTANYDVETLEFDRFIADLDAKITAYGGYTESSSISGNNIYQTSNRYAYYTIRLEQNSLDAFLSEVGKLGTVTNQSFTATDITLQYVDTEGRLNTLKAERDKLLELLDESTYVGETIELVNRLSEVNYEIESYTSQLRTFDNKITYSTVNLYVREVERYTATIVPEVKKTLWQRISVGFTDNLQDIADGIADFIVWFTSYIINIIFWCAVIAVIVILIARRIRKMRKKACDEKEERNKETNDGNMGN